MCSVAMIRTNSWQFK